MTSSLGLLTTPFAPTPDTTRPHNTDCTIVLPPFGVLSAHSGPLPVQVPIPITSSTSTSSTSECDAYDVFANHTRALAAQWTGAPIRAIAPLPRRTRVLNVNGNNATAHAHTGTSVLRRPRRRTRPAYLDSMDSDADNEGRDVEEEQGSDEDSEDRGVASGSRFFSYESITAAEGLSAWSFEELRVECYAQSLVARGTRPLPVAQPLLAIPPAFAPRVVSRNS